MRCDRRAFLQGRWLEEPTEEAAGGCHDSPMDQLPSDFTPALLRAQAKSLGLDVEAMTEEEVARAVLAAFRERMQRPESARDERLDKPAG